MTVRKCRVCKEKYTPVRSMQPVCDKYQCAVEYATRVADKRREKRAKEERAADKAKLESLLPVSKILKRVERYANACARERDKDRPCISCRPEYVNQSRLVWNAGHFHSVQSHPEIRFWLRNIHKQCSQCNCDKGGNHLAYEQGLIDRYGQAYVDDLKKKRPAAHYTREDAYVMLAYFKAMLRELRAGRYDPAWEVENPAVPFPPVATGEGQTADGKPTPPRSE